MIKFNDKDIFLVTGASSGIGKDICLRLNELGATLIGVARRIDRLLELKKDAKYPDALQIEVKDLAQDIESLPGWVLDLSKKYGRLKGLVMSAGMQQTIPLKAQSIKEAKLLFDLNYFANLALTKGFCDKRVNIGKGSSVVFISSNAAISGAPGIANYSASKGAICSAVRSLAVETARDGIRINAVLPGFVKTEMIDNWRALYGEQRLEEMEKKYPLGLGTPDKVSGLVCFLLSDSASWMTGQNIVIDGGGSL